MNKQKIVCPVCGHTVNDDNFCSRCATKLRVVCNCWVMNKAYDCGYEKCPGARLLVEKAKQKKENPI